MAFRTVNDLSGCFTPLVDKMLGNAFTVVKSVADKLTELTYLAENLGVFVPAAVIRVASDGTLSGGHGVSSVSKPLTGTYLVTFGSDLADDTTAYTATVIDLAGTASVITTTANSVTVEVRNSAGVVADGSFSLAVWVPSDS
jgi:hypothetical protein